MVVTPTEQLVFSNPSLSVDDPVFRSTVEGLVQDLRALPEVESVASYYDTQDPNMVSDDGSVLLAQVVIEGDADDATDKVDAILDTVRPAAKDADGFEIAMAGDTSITRQLEKIDEEDFGVMIIVTMVLALVLMLIAFRAVVAAVLPIMLAIGSIFSALGVAALVSNVYPMVEFLAQVVLLFGMAVGVDYSLFIVSRYRSERKAGRSKLEAIAVASNTTGRGRVLRWNYRSSFPRRAGPHGQRALYRNVHRRDHRRPPGPRGLTDPSARDAGGAGGQHKPAPAAHHRAREGWRQQWRHLERHHGQGPGAARNLRHGHRRRTHRHRGAGTLVEPGI